MSIDEHDVEDERDGLLSRWSRRKAAARAGTDLAEPATEVPPGIAAPPSPDAPPMPADADAAPVADSPAEDAPLPAMESLGEHSDYSAFLREKVPAAVRKQALRKLFSSAKFNIVDGLDDYDDDFRQILPLGDIITSDMRHKAEVEAERAKEKALAEARELEQEQEQSAAALEEDGEPAAVDAVESDAEAGEQQTLPVGEEAEPVEDLAAADPALADDGRTHGDSTGDRRHGTEGTESTESDDEQQRPDER